MIKPAEGDYRPLELEQRVREFWSRTKAYEKAKRLRERGKPFYFCDGPPYTSGSVHLGTALNKVMKDTVVRWRRMHDFRVRDQPGYDMHGLPIEVLVEKSLGITNKKEIEALGIERFVQTCRDYSIERMNTMTAQFAALGVWFDWDRPYMTIAAKYIEVAWWTLKKAHDRGLLVEAHRSVTWCPRCETALAEAEVEYAEVADPSVFVKFPLKDRAHESVLIWTTTPWTLPANMAVAVHPELQYAKVRISGKGRSEFLWILQDRVHDVMKEVGLTEYEVVDTARGTSMAGWAYEHPFVEVVPHQAGVRGEWVHKVLNSESVEAEDTGLVHIAPGHGPEDFDIGMRHGIPSFCPVDERGAYTEEAGRFAGKYVRDANAEVLAYLEEKGALLHEATVRHRYGQCWRCETPVLYRTTRQWFLKVTEFKEKMLSEIARVKWAPEWAGGTRQYEWTANLRDWCISRQRYWGTPLPIWRCGECRAVRVVGSLKELAGASGYAAEMDLHRPQIDQVTLPCKECGGTMRRVPDIADVWFDSGICTWAQLADKPDEFQTWFPADWICEAHDQTRGWFSAQLQAGILAFDSAPYEAVLLHGWMNGPDGQPMSKSKGNYIEPSEVVAKYGVDALRLYLLRVNAPWEDINFQWDDVKNAQRSLNILWNVYRFASTYMSMDHFDPNAFSVDALVRFMKPEDKWMLSRTERLKALVDAEMEQYNLHRAARLVEDFILEDLSRLYVKLIRDRTWGEGEDRGKLAAYKVLHEALLTAVKCLAPFCPHLTEEIYQNLDGRLLSVHMADWPVPNQDWINAELETGMAEVQELVTHLLRLRQKANLKLRWPLREVALKSAPETLARALAAYREAFLDQANVKNLVLLGPDEDFPGMEFLLRANVEAISKIYKTWWTRIVTMLENRPPLEVKKALEKGEFKMGIEGQVIKIGPHMVAFEKKLPGGVVAESGPFGELYVDMRVTPEIQAEGFARELIRRIQQMRKELNLEVEDFVRVAVQGRKEIVSLLEGWKDVVARETRARAFVLGERPVSEEYVVEWTIEKETFLIGITPSHMGESLRLFTRIRGIDEKKAIALFDAGYTTLASLRLASANELTRIAHLSDEDVKAVAGFFGGEESLPCPVCGVALPPGARRCLRCLEFPREKTCPHCGAGLWQDQTLCDVCGKAWVAVVERPAVAVETPPAKAEPAVAVEPTPAKPTPVAAEPALPKAQPAPAAQPAVAQPEAAEAPALSPEPTAKAEEPAPQAPAVEAPARPGLRESSIYMVLEDRTERGWELFSEEVKRGRRALCVTRSYPDKVREKHPALADVPVLWLSNVGKDDAIRPKDLEKLSLSLEQFISGEGGIILLDGIEYLITNNNFITVLRLVQSLRDQIAINRAILLFPVSPMTLDQNQRSLLEREADEVIEVGRPLG